MIRRRAPIWNVMFLLAFVGIAMIVLGSMYGWSNAATCYGPVILFILAAICMGTQEALDKYGRLWDEAGDEKSVLTETREVPDVVDGVVEDLPDIPAPARLQPPRRR